MTTKAPSTDQQPSSHGLRPPASRARHPACAVPAALLEGRAVKGAPCGRPAAWGCRHGGGRARTGVPGPPSEPTISPWSPAGGPGPQDLMGEAGSWSSQGGLPEVGLWPWAKCGGALGGEG